MLAIRPILHETGWHDSLQRLLGIGFGSIHLHMAWISCIFSRLGTWHEVQGQWSTYTLLHAVMLLCFSEPRENMIVFGSVRLRTLLAPRSVALHLQRSPCKVLIFYE